MMAIIEEKESPRKRHPHVREAFVDVALPLPLGSPLTYRVPSPLKGLAKPGVRVLVPLGRRKLTGYVVSSPRLTPPEGLPLSQIKPLEEILEETPALDSHLLSLTRWAADYYCASWGEVIKTALPGLPERKSVFRVELTPEGRASLDEGEVSRRREGRKLLELLNARGPMTLGQIRVHLGPRASELSSRLEARGLIRRSLELPPLPREGSLLWAEASRPATDEELEELTRRAPVQGRLLDLIGERGSLPVASAEAEVKRARQALNGLSRRGLVRLVRRPRSTSRALEEESLPGEAPFLHELTPAQARALKAIREALRRKSFKVFLLHGVTGSGKTEIYLQAIAEVLGRGGQALVLVPEIGLTPQLLGRFRSRFGDVLARLHSGLSPRERAHEWERIRRGEASIVVGARSAVFAPLKKLSLVVVDEEHDSSYKQEESPRYHGRDVATMRAKLAGAVALLGSATPSAESYHNSTLGKYQLLRLPERVGGRPLPKVRIVDMRGRGREADDSPLISEELRGAMGERLERGEQTLLFLNRRGFASFILCRDCGRALFCPRCSVTLTFHREERLLRCHYCERALKPQDLCPHCGSFRIGYFGLGTQRLEEAVQAAFPGVSLGRMDRDTTRRLHAHSQILGRLGRGEIQVLIGTQMIAKGHHFPRVTLVGVIASDIALHLPDFRAPERTFQLLTQVAGRAGRGELPGEVIIQAYRSDHYALRFAQAHDFRGFMQEELAQREALGYPPFKRLARVRLEGRDDRRVKEKAHSLARAIEPAVEKEPGAELLGPARAAVERVRDTYRWQLLLKAKEPRALKRLLGEARALLAASRRGGIHPSFDVDPVSIY